MSVISKKQKQNTRQSLIFDNLQYLEGTLERKEDPAPWRKIAVKLLEEKIEEKKVKELTKKLNELFKDYQLDLIPEKDIIQEYGFFLAKLGL